MGCERWCFSSVPAYRVSTSPERVSANKLLRFWFLALGYLIIYTKEKYFEMKSTISFLQQKEKYSRIVGGKYREVILGTDLSTSHSPGELRSLSCVAIR